MNNVIQEVLSDPGALIQIIIFDLILSGDNAVVIGVVASRLQGRQRRMAILVGEGGAVVLRIGLASIATLLLGVPVISLVGGLALFWIGWRLLKPEGDEEQHSSATTFAEAIRLIILADVVMSLDNVLTVAGAAHGNIWLLVFGLALSIPLLFVGSGLIAVATDRAPLIIYLGSALIFRIAVILIVEDPALHDRLAPNLFVEMILPWIAAVAGPALYITMARRHGRPTTPFWASPFAGDDERESSTKTATTTNTRSVEVTDTTTTKMD